jgi:phosphoglucosamine mutase
MGVDVFLAGVIPTPAVSFLTRSLQFSAGVVISASHNSFEDNGIKFFSPAGTKFSDEQEQQLEEEIFSESLENCEVTEGSLGETIKLVDAEEQYMKFIKNTLNKDIKFKGLKIVLDCANGAAYKVAPQVLQQLEAGAIIINDRPDGYNINEQCGATDTRRLREEVLKQGADLGFALDGDGDRLICVDEKGEELDGDCILGICALVLLKENKLKNNSLVVTLMSNLGLDKALSPYGGKVIRTAKVGDKYVLGEMLKQESILGGESSGHLIFREYLPTGDGLLSALQLLNVVRKSQVPLSELKQPIKKFPQVLKSVKVKKKIPLSELRQVKEKIKEGEKILGEQGRIVVRYSGTEPKVRIMVEGQDQEEINKIADNIAEEFE